MSDKTRKLKDKASRLTAKGKYKDALVEYEKCLRIDPRDLTVRQKLADTYARLGMKDKAVAEYQSVAGSYAADGLLLKAIAISKVILGLDPGHTETQQALAGLYAKKRGDFGPVHMPKSMSAALKKNSAATIRGTPARSIRSKDGAEVELDLDDADVLEEVSVTDTPIVAPIKTDLADLMSMVGGDGAGQAIDVDMDIDVVDAAPSGGGDGVLMGQLVDDIADVPDDIEDLDDDDYDLPDDEMIDIVEPVEINTDALPPIPLFSDLPGEAFIALTERMNLHQAEPGEILIAEGEYASSMFVIIQGTVRVVRDMGDGREVRLATLTDGAFFGEMALLSDAPRTASVIADNETMLFEISRELLDEITAEYPQVQQVMQRFHRNRMLTNLLKTSPLFAPFSPADKRSLIQKFKSRDVAPGRTLITRAQPGNGLYVLLSGRCDVLTQGPEGREVVLAELREGDVFGEMSVLFKQAASASVRATTPCTVLRLAKERVDELIMTHPQILETLSELSARRSSENRDLLGDAPVML